MFQTGVLSVLLTIFGTVVRAGEQAIPTVTLDNATVTGVASGATNHFLGIRFAQPPTGNLRFRLPEPLPPYNTSFSAVTYGNASETINYLSVLTYNSLTSAEDCLMLNVIAPADATPESKLPVVVWIYPGAFELDGAPLHDGAPIVERSISLGVPAVYVSMNHRENAFGYLASQEVKDAGVGNIGLQDQRLALRWVQKYISAFGGDPTKVTIWGYSSSAICVAMHMLTNGGDPEGLFRAAIMQGGSLLPVGDITHGQPYYDALVAETGCSGASDTLQCLREVPYDTLLKAVNQSPGPTSYQSMHLAWLPRVDGVFLTDNPLSLVKQGGIASVPFIAGNCDDDGTFFSLANSNVTTDAEFEEYIRTYYLPNASQDTIDQVMKYYPSDPTQGSPYDTGYLNALTPQFKRLSSVQGDAGFQGPRRFLLQHRSGKQNMWTYLNKRLKAVPFLGSFHGSDFLGPYGISDMTSYVVRFIANLDPNIGDSDDLYWPQYDAANQTMLELLDGLIPQALTTDTYRVEEIAYLTALMLTDPF